MLTTTSSATKSLVAKPVSATHHYDWLKESQIACPACRSSYAMPVRRAWYQKIMIGQKKFWCQDCGKFFWHKH